MVGTLLELVLPGAKASGGGMTTGTNLALATVLVLATGSDFNMTKIIVDETRKFLHKKTILIF